MMKIINDDMSIQTVNKNSNAGKVTPVKETLATQTRPFHGNNLPIQTAKFESDLESQKIIGSEKLEEAVRDLNEHVKTIKRELHFSIDDKSGQTVIKVMDSVTNEVIRQIPNEEAVKAARRLAEGVDLSLLNEYS